MTNEDGDRLEYRPIIKDDDAQWTKVGKDIDVEDYVTPEEFKVSNDLDEQEASEQNTYKIKVIEVNDNQPMFDSTANYQPNQQDGIIDTTNQGEAQQDETINWPH